MNDLRGYSLKAPQSVVRTATRTSTHACLEAIFVGQTSECDLSYIKKDIFLVKDTVIFEQSRE